MATKIITSEKDIESLSFGDAYEIGIPEFDKFAEEPDGPLLLVNSKSYAEALRLEGLIAERFDEGPQPADIRETVTVDFTNTHAVVTSAIDQSVKISGDVRDGSVKLAAGKPSKRKLTDEGHGYISVNESRFPTP